MRLPTLCATMLLAALLPQRAPAAIFVCPGADGAPQTSDHLTADCMLHGGRELNPDGSVHRVILSPQQQAAADARQRLEQRDAQRQLDALREQRALLTRYPDAQRLAAAERDDLRTPQALIDNARQSLHDLAAERARLLQDAQFYPDGRYPPDLRNRFEANELLRRQQQQQLIAGQQQVIARTRAQYAALRQRMQPLWARTAAASASAAH
ncbi:hypothetical protein GALL_253920 [mine drainage metagenome]|uniref:DUF4124 domain-containing protein n=1 Tax=mine drainage metagenome TaxID=410659 RepID=A0A1J5R9E1_9ZZZZ